MSGDGATNVSPGTRVHSSAIRIKKSFEAPFAPSLAAMAAVTAPPPAAPGSTVAAGGAWAAAAPAMAASADTGKIGAPAPGVVGRQQGADPPPDHLLLAAPLIVQVLQKHAYPRQGGGGAADGA